MSSRRSDCAIACTLDLVGDRWTLLVIRDLFLGATYFEDFRKSEEGIAPNILGDRLRKLEEHGLVTRTPDELSLVCEESRVPPGTRHQGSWVALKLHGPFDFGLTGILAAVLEPLRDAGVGIFALSTFDTDYVLVAAEQLPEALAALRGAGHTVEGS